MKPFVLPLVAALMLGAAPAALADCTASLVQTQAALDKFIEAVAASGATATESQGALLSHDPSPGALAQTEAAIGDSTRPLAAQEALDKARVAQAAGNEAECEAQLAKARAAIGLK